jgi:hypothetical protein
MPWPTARPFSPASTEVKDPPAPLHCTVHKTLLLAAYGWLTVFGLAHFLVDVVSRRLRNRHELDAEAVLTYGLHSTYAMGQVMFGLLALLIASRHMELLSLAPSLLVAITAAIGWFVIAWLFMDYWEPKAVAGIFFLLITAAAVTS